MFKTSPAATFGLIAALAALSALAVTTIVTPGCTGPAAPQPCDFMRIAKGSAERVGGFGDHWELVALDFDSSVYVRHHQPPYEQAGVIHGPGVLIDKRSCRVCEVHQRGGAWLEEGHAVLLRLAPGVSG